MIRAFPKSRLTALLGCPLAAVAAGLVTWLLLAQRSMEPQSRVVVTVLVMFVAANLPLFFARILAAKAYQERLLYLYEELDPVKFLDALQPLQNMPMSPSDRCTLQVHLANGYLYAGQPERALEILDGIAPPDNALQMRGLILSNRSTCLLMADRLDEAQKAMNELKVLLRDKNCKKEFVEKAHHTLGYQQLCMDIARRKLTDIPMLERDFEQSRAPLHKLDVQYRLALAYQNRHQEDGYQRAKEYVQTFGDKTALPSLLAGRES